MKDINFKFYNAWCVKCLLKASNYKSLSLYQALGKITPKTSKDTNYKGLTVEQQTQLALEVR